MGKNKNVNAESPQNSPDRPSDDAPDLKRRIEALEKAAADLTNRVFDWQKTFTTIIFLALSALLTVYGVMSRLEVRDLTAKVDKSIDEMKINFDQLSRNALKEPKVEIVFKNKPLHGQTLLSGTSLTPFFLKNIGNKSTEPLSLRLFCSSNVVASGIWQPFTSTEPEFPTCYYATGIGVLTIAAGETWTIEEMLSVSLASPSSNAGTCKLLLFYGASKPAEAIFTVAPKQ